MVEKSILDFRFWIVYPQWHNNWKESLWIRTICNW